MKIPILSFICITSLIGADNLKGYEEIPDRSDLNILTPSLSERKTAKIRLDNDLEAYLISDPEADQSAAALAMEVGSWNDDPRYAGIAHFLEHLLFMGSATYPEENSYDKQIWDNGGTLNAYTAPDRTVYIFSVNNDAFLTTLDMFSHMFVDPLFNPSGIKRELHAVDQEHDKNIESDGSRLWMVFKETGNPRHPNARFSTGNRETLGGIPQNVVKRWHKNHYGSDRAHLVLYSTLPIEKLKTETARLFSSIPQSSIPLTPLKEKLFSEQQTGSIIAVKPFKDLRFLSMEWELSPDYVQNLDNTAHKLLGYIIGGRHASSLYRRLKDEGLIEDISSGMIRPGKETGLFSIQFDLTPQGAEQFAVVIERCFQTLNALKETGIPPHIFEEMKTMAAIDYAFQSRTTPYAFVQNHAHNLIDEPLETYPLKTILPTTYDERETRNFLTNLTPKSGAYFLLAAPELTGIQPDKKETWIGAEYTIRKISAETLAAWNTLPPHPDIALPEPNPFIPSNLTLVTTGASDTAHLTPHPQKLVENDYGTLYFWEDTQYRVPEISSIFDIYTPSIDGSARQIVLFDLFFHALDDRLAPILSFAEAASLRTGCNAGDMKVSLQVGGYSEKVPLLLNEIFNAVKSCQINEDKFKLYCHALESRYANVGKAMPISQGMEIYRNLLFNNAPKHRDKMAALQSVTYEDYLSFADHLLDNCYLEALVAGNMTEKEAHRIWTTVHETLRARPYPKKNHAKKQLLTLSPLQGPYKIPAQTESLGNAAILMIQQGELTFPRKASHSILAAALQEDFFDTLRTKQQTAYIAKAVSPEQDEQLYHLFLVQSTSHQPDELIARFELF
ncbi:MAG: insulinase family protein, partial [Chlamydiota bacterium]